MSLKPFKQNQTQSQITNEKENLTQASKEFSRTGIEGGKWIMPCNSSVFYFFNLFLKKLF